ncbi:hypothetical protein D9M69_409440 [compost metagenome]
MGEAAAGIDRLTQHEPLLGPDRPNTPGQEVGGTQIGRQADCRIPRTQLHRFRGQHEIGTQGQSDPCAAYRTVDRSHDRQGRGCQSMQRRMHRDQHVVHQGIEAVPGCHEFADVASGAEDAPLGGQQHDTRPLIEHLIDGRDQRTAGRQRQRVRALGPFQHNATDAFGHAPGDAFGLLQFIRHQLVSPCTPAMAGLPATRVAAAPHMGCRGRILREGIMRGRLQPAELELSECLRCAGPPG